MMLPRSKATDGAVNELAFAVAILVKGVLALGLADTLNDDLLGGLSSDATKALDGVVQIEDVAVFALLLGGLVRVAIGIEDLKQQLVAHLGAQTLTVGIHLGDVTTLDARLIR
jgi:hypothetical protein